MHRLTSTYPSLWRDIIFVYIAFTRPYLVRGLA